MKQIIAILIISSLNLLAFDNVSINLNFETVKGDVFNNIIKFGINNNATDGYDADLKESDLPGHPPGNMHALMKFYDETQQSDIYSYIDYRAIPDKDTFHIRYFVSVRFESNDVLKISWNNLKSIQKAVFIDRFNGLQYDIDMLKQDSVVIDNSAFDEFYIDIYYDKLTSIEEKITETANFEVFPNPFYDEINLTNQNMIKKIELFDNIGRLISNNLESINNLNIGFYYLKIYDLEGNIHTKKIIKGN